MISRRLIHRLEGLAFLVLAVIAFTLAHQQGFQILAWGFTSLIIGLIWILAGLCMGWLGRPNSVWTVLAFAAIMSGLRHLPLVTVAMQSQWSGTALAQMFWGTAFVCIGGAFARGLRRPKLDI